jgi:hypothetical protein
VGIIENRQFVNGDPRSITPKKITSITGNGNRNDDSNDDKKFDKRETGEPATVSP